MYWNCRIIRKTYEFSEETYGIVEVYYESDTDAIFGWSSEFEAPQGETLEELRGYIDWMIAAFDKPILDEAELLATFEGKPIEVELPTDSYFTMDELLDDLDDVALD